MAIKYKRESYHHPQRDYAPQGPFTRMSGGGDPKRRLIIIYIGVAVALTIFLGYDRWFRAVDPFAGQPLVRGEAVIVLKETRNTPKQGHILGLQVICEDGAIHPALAQTDSENWKNLVVGDRIGVVYQRGRSGEGVRVHEVGRVAIPKPDQ